jgi:hypothetical protein
MLLRAIALVGVVGAACLTRPVETWNPNLKTNFTSVIKNQAVDKLDLLFMVDNSASMGDKQALLAQAVPDMISRLVTPNCVDPNTSKVVGQSDPMGQCSVGKPEFPPVHDMHIGIVTSSLGGRGGNQCDPTSMNPANMNLSSHTDDNGQLINRGGDLEGPITNAQPLNFIAWYPPGAANMGGNNPPPPVPPERTVGAPGQPGTLIGDFTSMIQGVHEHGCGFEAQNEAWYRFLVQPDPFDKIVTDPMSNKATYTGVNQTILQQRKNFLRSDSLLAIIVVTDENEEVANPLAIGGEGWLYETAPFPASPSGGGAPEGTIECKTAAGPMTGPNDPNCTSCAFQSIQSAANFATRCPNDAPAGVQGFLDPNNDNVNVRFFNQKQRFGVFAGYPVSRYVRGLTSASVPDRFHEVDGSGNYVGDQDKFANCVNPIFAQDLPADASKDLCGLTRGPRTADLVYYAAIAGVPHELLQAQAGADPQCPAGTMQQDCPQKDTLTDADWQKIIGKDPEHYDFSGIDFHMLESEDPRGGCAPTSNDTCDPINGREWNTNKQDLQFSCIFKLDKPKDCNLMQYLGACDCAKNSNSQDTPLCEKVAGVRTNNQLYGKAYPSVREMEIAHLLNAQGIVSSLCPIHVTAANPTDPLYGYRPAVTAIINRLKNALSVQCLPQKLIPGPDGAVPCLILVTLPKQGGEDLCNNPALGLSAPKGDLLARFQAAQHAAWAASGGASSMQPDPSLFPVCVLNQLVNVGTMAKDFSSGTCAGSKDPGWCYIEGAAAGSCPQQILFTNGEPPHGSTVNLQCIEQAKGAVDGGS